MEIHKLHEIEVGDLGQGRSVPGGCSRITAGVQSTKIPQRLTGESLSAKPSRATVREREYFRPTLDQRHHSRMGVAERSNRSVVEMARCLRLESGLSKELWAEACQTAVHILNRVPSAVLDGKTPYFRLFGKQARLDHFKVFGCRAYVQILFK